MQLTKSILILLLVLLITPLATSIDYSVHHTPPHADNLTITAAQDITLHIKHISEDTYTTETGTDITYTTFPHIGRYEWHLEKNGEKTMRRYFYYLPNEGEHPLTQTYQENIENLNLNTCDPNNEPCAFEHEQARLIQLYSEAYRTTQNTTYKTNAEKLLNQSWEGQITTSARCDPSQQEFSCGFYNDGTTSRSGAYRQSIIIDSLWKAHLSSPNSLLREYAENFSNTPPETCNPFNDDFFCNNARNENALYAQAYLTAYKATLNKTYKDFAEQFLTTIQNQSSPEAQTAIQQAKHIGIQTPETFIKRPSISNAEQRYHLSQRGINLYHAGNNTIPYTIQTNTVNIPEQYIAQRFVYHDSFQAQPNTEYETILSSIRTHNIISSLPPITPQTTHITSSKPQINKDLFLTVHDTGNTTTTNITLDLLTETKNVNVSFPGLAHLPANDIQQSQFIQAETNTGRNETLTIPITNNYLETANESQQTPPRRFCDPFSSDFSCAFEYMQGQYAEKGSTTIKQTGENWFTTQLLTTRAEPGSNDFTTCEIGESYTCTEGASSFSEPGLYRAGTLASAYVQGYKETGNNKFLDQASRYLYNNHDGCGYQSSLDCTQKELSGYLEGLTAYIKIQPNKELQTIAQGVKINILDTTQNITPTSLNALLSYYATNKSDTLLTTIENEASYLQGTCITQNTCSPKRLYTQTKLFWDLYKETQDTTYYQEANALTQTQPETEQDACNPNTQNTGTEKYSCFYPDEQALLMDAFTTAATQNVIQNEINISIDTNSPPQTPFNTQANITCVVENIDTRSNTQPFTLQLLSDQTIQNISLSGDATATVDNTLVQIQDINQSQNTTATFTVNTTRGGKDQYTCSALGEQDTNPAEINNVGKAVNITQNTDTAFFQNNFTTTYTATNIHPFTLQNVTINTTLPIQRINTTQETQKIDNTTLRIPTWIEDGREDTSIDITLKHQEQEERTQNQTFNITGAYGVNQTTTKETTVLPNTINTTTPHPDTLKLFQEKQHNVTITNPNTFNLTNLSLIPRQEQGITTTINNSSNITINTVEPSQEKQYTVTYNVTNAETAPNTLKTTFQSPQINITRQTPLSIDTTYIDLITEDKEVTQDPINHTITLTSPIPLQDIDITYTPQTLIQNTELLNITRKTNETTSVNTATSQEQGNITAQIKDNTTTTTTQNITTTSPNQPIRAITIYTPNTTQATVNTETCNLTPPVTTCNTTQNQTTITTPAPIDIQTIVYNTTRIEKGTFGNANTINDIRPNEQRTIILTSHNHQDLPKDIDIQATSNKGATGQNTITLTQEPNDSTDSSNNGGGGGGSGGGGGGGGASSTQQTEDEQNEQRWTYTYTYSTRDVFSALTPDIIPRITAQTRLEPLRTQPCFNVTKTITKNAPHEVSINTTSCLEADTYTLHYQTPTTRIQRNLTVPNLQTTLTLPSNNTYTKKELNNTPYLIPRMPSSGTESQSSGQNTTQNQETDDNQDNTNTSQTEQQSENTRQTQANTFRIPIPQPKYLILGGIGFSALGIVFLFLDKAKKRGTYTKTKLKYLQARNKFKNEFKTYKKHHQRLTSQESLILSLKLRLKKIESHISEHHWKDANKKLEAYKDYVATHASKLENNVSERGEKQLNTIASRLQTVTKQISQHNQQKNKHSKKTKTSQEDVSSEEASSEDTENPSPSIYLKIKRSFILLNQKEYEKALTVLQKAEEEAKDIKELYPQESSFLSNKIEETKERVKTKRDHDKIYALKQKIKHVYKSLEHVKNSIKTRFTQS